MLQAERKAWTQRKEQELEVSVTGWAGASSRIALYAKLFRLLCHTGSREPLRRVKWEGNKTDLLGERWLWLFIQQS